MDIIEALRDALYKYTTTTTTTTTTTIIGGSSNSFLGRGATFHSYSTSLLSCFPSCPSVSLFHSLPLPLPFRPVPISFFYHFSPLQVQLRGMLTHCQLVYFCSAKSHLLSFDRYLQISSLDKNTGLKYLEFFGGVRF